MKITDKEDKTFFLQFVCAAQWLRKFEAMLLARSILFQLFICTILGNYNIFHFLCKYDFNFISLFLLLILQFEDLEFGRPVCQRCYISILHGTS